MPIPLPEDPLTVALHSWGSSGDGCRHRQLFQPNAIPSWIAYGDASYREI